MPPGSCRSSIELIYMERQTSVAGFIKRAENTLCAVDTIMHDNAEVLCCTRRVNTLVQNVLDLNQGLILFPFEYLFLVF